MGSRYWLTGVQLAMLLKISIDEETRTKFYTQIYDQQYLGEADDLIPFWFKKVQIKRKT